MNHPFTRNLVRSGRELEIPADKLATDVPNESGIPIDIKCSGGICGACKCRPVSGEVEHRNLVLSKMRIFFANPGQQKPGVWWRWLCKGFSGVRLALPKLSISNLRNRLLQTVILLDTLGKFFSDPLEVGLALSVKSIHHAEKLLVMQCPVARQFLCAAKHNMLLKSIECIESTIDDLELDLCQLSSPRVYPCSASMPQHHPSGKWSRGGGSARLWCGGREP